MKKPVIKIGLLILLQIMQTNKTNHCFANDSLPEIDTFLLGQQIFFGNFEKLDSGYSCVQCHYLESIDTFNWNPSAFEIASTFAEKEVSDYEDVLLYAVSEKMYTAHEGAENLEETEIIAIKSYLNFLKEKGPPPPKYFPVKEITFTATLFLILLVFVAGIFYRKIRIRYFHRITLTVLFGFLIIIVYNNVVTIGLQPEYEPEQPLKFSHKTHSSQNGTTCIYCHPAARYSASAGMPGINVCMNCHSLVREGTQSGEREIKKVINASEQQKAIHWIRINNLPEHVQFNHALHYQSGKIDCTECHGTVEQIDRIKQIQSLSMKWCLDCHKTKKLNRADNKFYSSYRNLNNEFHHLTNDSTFVKDLGGWDCMNCHY